MFKRIRQFFLTIREKDEPAKKRWLILLTSISMAIVIIFWGFYLNQTIKSIADNEQSDKNEEFFSVFKNGAKILAKETGSKFSKLIDSLQSLLTDTNSITIENTGDSGMK